MGIKLDVITKNGNILKDCTLRYFDKDMAKKTQELMGENNPLAQGWFDCQDKEKFEEILRRHEGYDDLFLHLNNSEVQAIVFKDEIISCKISGTEEELANR